MNRRKSLKDIGVAIEAQADGSIRVLIDDDWCGDFSPEEAKMIARALNAEAKVAEADRGKAEVEA